MVWFQALLQDRRDSRVSALARRLALSRVEQKIVSQSAKSYPALLGPLSEKPVTASRMHRLLCPLRPEVQCFLTAVAPPALAAKMKSYFIRVGRLTPWVRGRDLQALGIPAGFRYSFILLEALNGQLDGKFKDRRSALEWVRKSFAP